MSAAPLRLNAITKSFDGRPAIRSLSFDVPKGSILGFLGPNGAGKSTSLRIALGVMAPDAGEVSLFGVRPNLDALKRVGFLPEERGLYRKMTTKAIIVYFARLKGMSAKDASARAEQLLVDHGLGDQIKTRISRLSKGMAQKVQILAALAHSPEFIILDEPFSGLDPVNQQDLEALIRAEHARGATIVFSTHVMEHAERLCDRLVLIAKGEKRFDGTVDEALGLLPHAAKLSTDVGFDLARALSSTGFAAEADGSPSEAGGQAWRIALPVGLNAQDALRAAIEAGVPIRAFAPDQPRLRDVFVSLAGDDAVSAEDKAAA
ncbi:MAG: ATP-binding cassette domain-containing protein [Pseudomonadota bacterium]